MLTQTQRPSVINDTAIHSVTTTEFQGEKLYLVYLPLWVYLHNSAGSVSVQCG